MRTAMEEALDFLDVESPIFGSSDVYHNVLLALIATAQNPELNFVAFVSACESARLYPAPDKWREHMARDGHKAYDMTKNPPLCFSGTMPSGVICDRRLRTVWTYLRKNLQSMPARWSVSLDRWKYLAKGVGKIISSLPEILGKTDEPKEARGVRALLPGREHPEDVELAYLDSNLLGEPAAGQGPVNVLRELVVDPEFDRKHARNSARLRVDYIYTASRPPHHGAEAMHGLLPTPADHLSKSAQILCVFGGVIAALEADAVKFMLVHPGEMPHDMKPGMPSTCKSGGAKITKKKRQKLMNVMPPRRQMSVFMATERRANIQTLTTVLTTGNDYGCTADGGLTAFACVGAQIGTQKVCVVSPLHRLALIVDATLVPGPGAPIIVKDICLIMVGDKFVADRMSAAGKFPQQQYVAIVLTSTGLCMVECWQPKKRSVLPDELQVFLPALAASASKVYSPRSGILCILGPKGEIDMTVALSLGEKGVEAIITTCSPEPTPRGPIALPCHKCICPVTGSACTLHFTRECVGFETSEEVWGTMTWVFPDAATWTISLRGIGDFSGHWWALPKRIAAHRTVLGAPTDQCHVYILTPGAGVDDVLVKITATYCTLTGTGTCKCSNLTAALFAAPALITTTTYSSGSLSLLRGRQQGLGAWDVGVPTRVNLGVPVMFTLLAGMPAQHGKGGVVHLLDISAKLLAE